MGYIDKEHIAILKKEFYRQVIRSEKTAYITLQILCERVTKRHLSLDPINATQGLAYCLKKLKMQPQNIKYSGTIDQILILNSIANRIKHSEETIVFNRNQIESFIESYNEYVEFVLKASLAYLIDEEGSIRSNATPKSFNEPLKTKDSVEIFVGTNNQDYGFSICNLVQSEEIENPIYATIYNFLQRSNLYKGNQFLENKKIEKGYEINVSRVYRIEMAILSLIRFGYCQDNKLYINCEKYNRELLLAVEDIKNYFSLFEKICNCNEFYVDLILSKEDGISLDFDLKEKQEGIIIKNREKRSNCFYSNVWFSPRLVFDIESKEFEHVMRYFLKEFFGYDSFLPNQLECLIHCINRKKAMCILPTGAGKSLIFYMIALLSPSPSIIISPTKILIEDQVRNLKERYGIVDVFFEDGDEETQLTFGNKFIYLTPEQIQYKSLILKLIDYNVKYKIGNVFLDEIHCACNWSHDFRPSYFVLAYNIASFMDNAYCVGFTATANYRTINDIIYQLSIDLKDVVKPITFNPDLYNFRFLECKTEDHIFSTVLNCIDALALDASPKDKVIVFTQNIDETNQVWEIISSSNENISRFDEIHTYSYADFLKEKQVLVANSDMGVGINLPNVKSIINYGYPISKANFVQEIGRATRANEKGNSFVVFKSLESLDDFDRELINCNTDISRLIQLLKEAHPSNLVSILKKIVGRFGLKDKMLIEMQELLSFFNYHSLKNIIKTSTEGKEKAQTYFYILKNIGVVENWYLYKKPGVHNTCYFQVELHDIININTVKEKTLNYFNKMSVSSEYCNKIINAPFIKDIVDVYLDWFYNEYLYFHREQLINLIDFINVNKNKSSRQIGIALSSYFSTNLIEIDESKTAIAKLNFEEILEMNSKMLSNKRSLAEELLLLSYNLNYDLMILMSQILNKENNYTHRYIRILEQLDINQLIVFVDATWKKIHPTNILLRRNIIEVLTNKMGFNYTKMKLYKDGKFDSAYFSYLMSICNSILGGPVCLKTKKN